MNEFTKEYTVVVWVDDKRAANHFVNSRWHEIEADDMRSFEKVFDNLQGALDCYLVQYARDDIPVCDCSVIAEYCLDGKLVGEEFFENLLAANTLARRINADMLKQRENEIESLRAQLGKFEPVLQLDCESQKQILDFTKRKLEA